MMIRHRLVFFVAILMLTGCKAMIVNSYKRVDIRDVMKLEVVAPDSVSVGDSIRCVVRFINTSDRDEVFNKNGQVRIGASIQLFVDQIVFYDSDLISEFYNEQAPRKNIILSAQDTITAIFTTPSIVSCQQKEQNMPTRYDNREICEECKLVGTVTYNNNPATLCNRFEGYLCGYFSCFITQKKILSDSK